MYMNVEKSLKFVSDLSFLISKIIKKERFIETPHHPNLPYT